MRKRLGCCREHVMNPPAIRPALWLRLLSGHVTARPKRPLRGGSTMNHATGRRQRLQRGFARGRVRCHDGRSHGAPRQDRDLEHSRLSCIAISRQALGKKRACSRPQGTDTSIDLQRRAPILAGHVPGYDFYGSSKAPQDATRVVSLIDSADTLARGFVSVVETARVR